MTKAATKAQSSGLYIIYSTSSQNESITSSYYIPASTKQYAHFPLSMHTLVLEQLKSYYQLVEYYKYESSMNKCGYYQLVFIPSIDTSSQYIIFACLFESVIGHREHLPVHDDNLSIIYESIHVLKPIASQYQLVCTDSSLYAYIIIMHVLGVLYYYIV